MLRTLCLSDDPTHCPEGAWTRLTSILEENEVHSQKSRWIHDSSLFTFKNHIPHQQLFQFNLTKWLWSSITWVLFPLQLVKPTSQTPCDVFRRTQNYRGWIPPQKCPIWNWSWRSNHVSVKWRSCHKIDLPDVTSMTQEGEQGEQELFRTKSCTEIEWWQLSCDS